MTGLELRGCWAERPAGPASTDDPASRSAVATNAAWRDVAVRQFVPVEDAPRREPEVVLDVPLAAVEPEPWEPRVSLFGDLER